MDWSTVGTQIKSDERTAVWRLAQRLSTVRNDHDKAAIRRHAASIYNIAERKRTELTKKIETRNRVQRCPNRLRWVSERMHFKLIQDDCKEIVELLEGISNDA